MLATLEQFAVGKTTAQLKAIADVKAVGAAAAKAAAAKGTGAGTGTIWTGKGLIPMLTD